MAPDNDRFTVENLEKRIKEKLGEMLQLSSESVDLDQAMTHYGVTPLSLPRGPVKNLAWVSRSWRC